VHPGSRSRYCDDVSPGGHLSVCLPQWKPEGKRPHGRSSRKWEDNIKMDHQEVGCGGVDWIDLA